MNLLINNGTLITAGGRRVADVVVSDGKIAAIHERGVPGSGGGFAGFDKMVDATGLFVLPGAIDAHTHFELPFPGAISADNFYTGTRAAACGGVTAVIDFVTPNTGETLLDALAKRRASAAPNVCVDYALHMSLIDVHDGTVAEMKAAVNAGITGFKVFMTYDFRVSDEDFCKVLRSAKEIGALVMVHAEEHGPLEALKAEFIAKGKTESWHHYLCRPEFIEALGVRRAIALAEKVGAMLYIVHLACADGLKEVEQAQRRGSKIYAETCPQYLHFTNDVYKLPDAQNFVCSPPIKGEASRDALLEGLRSGVINTVATDHCPFTLAEKARGKDFFPDIPNGVMGVEILYPYMLHLANQGHISFEHAVGLCCENPARIFGLSGSKGTIAPGMDADIVLYDPRKEFVVSQDNMHSANDYTIWEGVQLKGCITRTYSRGKLVYDDGIFLGGRAHGKFIRPPRDGAMGGLSKE